MKKAWAVKLRNGKFADDGKNDVTPALFPTRRAAQAWWSDVEKALPGKQGTVVRVVATVKEV